jgi:MtN3 and saliva related transmembrane protein
MAGRACGGTPVPPRLRKSLAMELADWVGTLAAICTTGAYFPQVVRVVRTRSTQDISLWMCLVLVTGVALWLAYGLMKGEMPIILANGITLASSGIILLYKLRYG